MNALAVWLKSIIAAIMLAGFLQMLLPDNELRGVTRMVMGLVILLILLQPLFQVFHMPLELLGMVQGMKNEPSQLLTTEQVVKQGMQLRNQWIGQFEVSQHQYLEEKLRNILQLIDGIKIKTINLIYDATKLKRVIVEVIPVKREEPVAVWQGEIKYKIINSVQLICNITADQVEVVWK